MVIIFSLMCCFLSCKNTTESLESIFQHPPDSMQMSIYWYWISDNISREGVIKDLEAMKKIGITRAIIANVGL